MMKLENAVEAMLSAKDSSGRPLFSLNDVARFVVAREDAATGWDSRMSEPQASSDERPTVPAKAA